MNEVLSHDSTPLRVGSSPSLQIRFSAMIGNVLKNYDSSLYGLLAPFIAPLFFDNRDPLLALILTYALLPVGMLTKPIGALFFGRIGDRFGRKQALFLSLFGMACATFMMGCIPTYKEVGVLAPVLLTLARMFQSFSAAGEGVGAAIFVLEHTCQEKRSFMSSLYGVSTIIGTFLASALIAFFSSLGTIESSFRFLFWFGGLTAFLGAFLRYATEDTEEFKIILRKTSIVETIFTYKKELLFTTLAAGFSYTTYSTAFTLMNGYVPMISSISKEELMKINTALLGVDFILLPCFGYLTYKVKKEVMMATAALCLAVGAIPLFHLLYEPTIAKVIFLRLTIVMLGVAFAAPYHAWAITQVPPQHRYTILSLAGAFGSQCIGAPTASISLWLYRQTGCVIAPGFYLAVIASAAFYSVLRCQQKRSASQIVE
ncbi:MAG: hypothetical protein JWO53_673 [Chlamydiia bacterium]|nr:hypothetical protein [Chlamydiia bacterium]